VRPLLLLAIFAAALPAQDPSDAAWQLTLRLAQVKRQVRTALASQPDYTCLATYDRYRWIPNAPTERKVDTVRVEVAYLGGHELYSWPGEGKFSDVPLTQMVAVGLVSDGDFAVHAHNIFVAGMGTEKFAGEEQRNGRKLWRWNYAISSYSSGWTVQHSGVHQTVGSEGSYWIDSETLDLVRMDTHATDFMSSFPLKSVVSTVNYARVRIGEQEALLPVEAELHTVTKEGTESRNLTRYSNCRQYAGQSTISFGEVPEVVAPVAAQAKRSDEGLPAGLTLKIRLAADLILAQGAVGTLVEGTLDAPLRHGGKELAPKGAAVRGRVRLLSRDIEEFAELGLVFDELDVEGHAYRFVSSLKSFDTITPGVRMNMLQDKTYKPVPRGVQITRNEISATQVEGASVFFIDRHNSSLPKGTLMTWIVQ
jgi:hypothetical protein